MQKFALWLGIGLSLVLFVGAIEAATPDNHIPDFYQEPGAQPERDYSLGADGTESIDPFSGMLRLTYTDLSLPGNGGLDLNIVRNYQNIQGVTGIVGQDFLADPTTTGNNWSIHMGRVLSIDSLIAGAGSCPSSNVNGDRNPVLELADGSKQVLFDADAGSGYEFISQQFWRADCISTGGLEVLAPDGTRYVFDQFRRYRDVSDANTPVEETHAWHVSLIEDRNGNTLSVSYQPGDWALIDEVNASDGRLVRFTYTPVPNTNRFLLTQIQAFPGGSDQQTWTYSYTDVPNQLVPHQFLTQVDGPENLTWTYEYYGLAAGQPEPIAAYSLRRVISPYGGTTDYTYQHIDVSAASSLFVDIVAVATKTTSGPDITSGVWSWNFFTQAGTNDDFTEVTTPVNRELYRHCGARAGNAGDCPLLEGSLLEKSIFETSGSTPLQTETYTWELQQVAQQIDRRPSRNYASGPASAPRLVRRTVERDSELYNTQYSNYDQFNNPGQIDEYTGTPGSVPSNNANPFAGDLSRTTTRSYIVDQSAWILHLPEDDNSTEYFATQVLNVPMILRGILKQSDVMGMKPVSIISQRVIYNA